MNRHIIRQLWNQRRANGWILAELVFVTFFLWGVMDPVYVLLSNRAIEDGYDLTDTYLLRIGEYPATHRFYQQDAASDSIRVANYQRIVDRIKQYPGVEATVVTLYDSYPQSGSWSGTMAYHDSIAINVQQFIYLADGDYFGVFQMKTATGKAIAKPIPTGENCTYLTEDVSRKLFPNIADPIGQMIHYGDTTQHYRLSGILAPIQSRSIQQPVGLSLLSTPSLFPQGLPDGMQICFRVRHGLASVAFTDQFRKEIRPQLQLGNFYLLSVTDFETVSRDFEYSFGVTGKLRLQVILASFFLLCTFLGMAGTFWLRCNARRSEIGLRMALGGSRKTIHCHFLGEAWMLTTTGFILGLFIVFQRVCYDGFAEPTVGGNSIYLQNQPIPHFLIVSAITYLLLISIAIIGTWIPATRAARTQPSDALRDE